MALSSAMALSPAQFQETFPDEPSCVAYLLKQRWPYGFVCPVCGSGRAAWLESRAYTHECLNCGRQTSITAGTVMHRSKLPLTLWFQAAHLIATDTNDLSVLRLQALLDSTYKTAWLLKQKFRRSMNSQPLDGIVEVGHTEIPVSVEDDSLTPSEKIAVAAALQMSFCQVRLAAIPDKSATSIEAFVRANVKPGATLRVNPHLPLTNYSYDTQRFDPMTPTTFSLLRDYRRRPREPVGIYLARFVDYHNDYHRQVSFDTVLGIASRCEPMSYWDIIGRDNPRRGVPTTRGRPRRRKTATGMREDTSGPG